VRGVPGGIVRGVNGYKVGILGATGLVGQRLVERLAGHPWFVLQAVAASDRSAGLPYGEAARWALGADVPDPVAGLTVRRCLPQEMTDCDVVLSGLDATVAAEVEPAFARAGFPVISNSSAFRLEPDVPLVVPEINPSHLRLIEAQQRRTGAGFVVTNPNCCVTGLALALAPLHGAFGVRRAVVTTMQAVSGAGLAGPRGMDLLDNVLPYIPGEEDKIERELAKILDCELAVSAHCNRVGTLDGHLETVSVELARPASPQAAAEVLRAFQGSPQGRGLPSSPDRVLIVRDEPDRPQPRLDRGAGGGMAVTVGRLRPCPVFTLRFVVLSHNTVRGAAGGALLNAEMIAAAGWLEPARAALRPDRA
jgi:aspartate-semialdehyde dehydrogenase